MIREERLVQEFLEMVRIPSPSKKEGSFAAYLKDKLEKLGFTVIRDEKSFSLSGCETGNLAGRLTGTKEGIETILFSAHLDTVTPCECIVPIVENGVIKSDGTSILGADDKSGIAPVLEAIRHLQEEKIPHGPIEVLFTVGEEIGLLGSRYYDPALITSGRAFVLDSGGAPGTIINRGPSHDKIKAVIHGRAAHAGVNPESGVSAIKVAARAIDRMKLLRIDEETTANIGIISGGAATNIVPDKVELEGEARSLTEEKLDCQTRHMLDCLEEACRELGARLTVENERAYNAFCVDKTDPLILLAAAAARRVGLEEKIISTGGGSDTNYFNSSGIKAITLGTGMTAVHTTEEHIWVEDLVNTARLVTVIITEAAGSKTGFLNG